jgi:hypothetical protein
MYSHCIFCKAELGHNEAIEKFPVGRRLAFDAARGRLWVVCRGCARWNLTPLEERWEAIEQCERLYRDTRTRVATEHIGLAQLPDGTELVRIGKPQLPEFAAWRYGEQLVQRRQKYWLAAAGTGVAIIVLAGVPLVAGMSAISVSQIPNIVNAVRSRRTIARVTTAGGEEKKIRRWDIGGTGLFAEGGKWFLDVAHKTGATRLEREAAARAAALLLPHINASGARPEQVQTAVREIEQTPNADQFFLHTAERLQPKHDHKWAAEYSARTGRRVRPAGLNLSKAPVEIRLALEMAAHESQERRALEGELAELESMWQEAEEIASISDNLLLPARIAELFKGKTPPPEAKPS